MRFRRPVAVVALVPGGCAGNPERDDQAANAPQQIESADCAATEGCLSTFEYGQVEILDEQHLLFEGNGTAALL